MPGRQDLLELVDILQVTRTRGSALHLDQVGNRRNPDFDAIKILHDRIGQEVAESDRLVDEDAVARR